MARPRLQRLHSALAAHRPALRKDPRPGRRLLRFRVAAAAIWPWRVLGSNAIAAFTVSVLLVKLLLYFHHGTTPTGKPLPWMGWIYATTFARHGSTELTSLAFAIAFDVACFLPILWLWRTRIFLKL